MIAREICQRVLERAAATGADYAELFAEHTPNHAINMVDSKVFLVYRIISRYNRIIFLISKGKRVYEDKESDKCMSCADMSGNRAFRMWKNRSSI